MNDPAALITDHLDIWTSAIERQSAAGRGRGKSNRISLYGIEKLRALILDLAIRGKLVPQHPNDEPASELLKRIKAEKAKLIAEGKIRKPKFIKKMPDEFQEIELPVTWKIEKLGNISTVITDGTHHTPKYLESGISFISVKYINGRAISFDDCRYISEAEHHKINERCNPEFGDILICRIGTLGRVTLVDTKKPFSLFVSVGLIKYFQDLIVPTYLHLTMHSPFLLDQYQLIKAGGSHTNKLNLSDLPMLHIPIPPLAEQRRIVARVDELMGLCDDLQAGQEQAIAAHQLLVKTLLKTLTDSKNAKDLAQNWSRLETSFDTLFTTEDSINQLKQTILQLAVMGKLVEQHPDDEPASELLKRLCIARDLSYQQEGLRQRRPVPKIERNQLHFHIPNTWELSSFDDLFAIVSGITKGNKVSTEMSVELPYLRVANVQRGYLDLSVMKNIVVKIKDANRYHLRYGDVLMTEGGDWDKVGRAAIWRNEITKCIHQNHIFRVRPPSEEIIPEWIISYANSELGRKYFELASKQTTNLASINMTQLRSYPIPIPPPCRTKAHRR